jgi:hypothetical protein
MVSGQLQRACSASSSSTEGSGATDARDAARAQLSASRSKAHARSPRGGGESCSPSASSSNQCASALPSIDSDALVSAEPARGGGPGEPLCKCESCGRRFSEEAFTRHTPLLCKSAQKKRAPLDVQGQRVKGMAHAEYVAEANKQPTEKPRRAVAAAALPPPRRCGGQIFVARVPEGPTDQARSEHWILRL